MLPAAGLGHERHVRGAPAAEQDRRDRHTRGVLPLGSDRRALVGRCGEAGVGVGRRGVGLGRPVVAAPVDEVGRELLGEALPPDVDWTALGLVFSPVPGATPKNPASGLMAYRRPSSPNFIQAMSSPTVSTFHPGRVGMSIAMLVLPHAEGNAAAT